ncbi:sensor histidine kinase [Microbacterium sp.]|uniref:sensor histidine kinase n=1 Tax=Microbacterium sp. TaxID=51671 RepID=UPI003F987929
MDTMGEVAKPDARIDGNGVLVSAAVMTVIALPLTVVTLLQAPGIPVDGGLVAWLSVLSVLLHAAGFLSRWTPVVAFVAGSALMLVFAFTTIPGYSSAAMLPSCVAYLLLVWKMASDGGTRRSFGALAVGVTGAGLITTVDALRQDGPEPLMLLVEGGALVAGIVAAWALGALSRLRRLAAAERAEERIRLALAEERNRIGRDLHDIVAHSLSVMIAQAEAARLTAGTPGSDGELERVAETGRSAMQGLRGMLGVLGNPESQPLEPVQGIDGVPALVARARSAEHTIAFAVRGEPRPLAPDAGLAAYRVTQEALTNAIRHLTAPLSIEVDVEWREREVAVTVTDDGGQGTDPHTGAPRGGTGLIGMAERVERAGGTLEIRRSVGWRVRAVLPIEASS